MRAGSCGTPSGRGHDEHQEGLIGDEPTPAVALDDAVRAGLTATGIPGAVVLVARQGNVVHLGAYGAASTHDQSGPFGAPVRMVGDTVFDVASITKLVATTGVAMAMVDQGKLDLDSSASRFIPELRGGGKDQITVAQLLAHRSGLPAWHPLFLHTNDRAEAVAVACAQPLVACPGEERIYSDLGMIALGAILELVCDERLDVAASRLVFEPLGMDRTRFLPRTRRGVAATSTGNPVERDLVAAMPDGAAPADRVHAWRCNTLVGEVNDANAALAMGGVAGHAGVFSTARDLASFAQALLDSGSAGGHRIWSPATVARFLRPGPDPDQGLGVWLRRASAALSVELGGDASFGHRGFTGCELAASPQGRWVAVLLTNRLHADAHPPPAHDGIWREVIRWVLAGVPADRTVG